jgi:hypothetical protein
MENVLLSFVVNYMQGFFYSSLLLGGILFFVKLSTKAPLLSSLSDHEGDSWRIRMPYDELEGESFMDKLSFYTFTYLVRKPGKRVIKELVFKKSLGLVEVRNLIQSTTLPSFIEEYDKGSPVTFQEAEGLAEMVMSRLEAHMAK